MKYITLIIPVYNEQESIDSLLERLNLLDNSVSNYQFEFLFINDGSRDQTLDIITKHAQKDTRISYINLSRNFGNLTDRKSVV